MACGISSAEAALARIWSTLMKRIGCGVSAAWVAEGVGIERRACRGIKVVQRVDRGRWRSLDRRTRRWIGVGELVPVTRILDRGPGGQHDVVLVHAHHVGAFAAEHADDFEGDVLDADFLAHRRFALEKLPLDGLANQADLAAVTHVAIGERCRLRPYPPNRGPPETTGWCRRSYWAPSCGCRR